MKTVTWKDIAGYLETYHGQYLPMEESRTSEAVGYLMEQYRSALRISVYLAVVCFAITLSVCAIDSMIISVPSYEMVVLIAALLTVTYGVLASRYYLLLRF